VAKFFSSTWLTKVQSDSRRITPPAPPPWPACDCADGVGVAVRDTTAFRLGAMIMQVWPPDASSGDLDGLDPFEALHQEGVCLGGGGAQRQPVWLGHQAARHHRSQAQGPADVSDAEGLDHYRCPGGSLAGHTFVARRSAQQSRVRAKAGEKLGLLHSLFFFSPSFDEVHFGKFTNYYLRGTYFFDLHPPLAKLLLALLCWLLDYDGSYPFYAINDSYEGWEGMCDPCRPFASCNTCAG